MTHVRCHMSVDRCQVSDLTCDMLVFMSKQFLYGGANCCYQQGLPRLVFIQQQFSYIIEKYMQLR